MSRNKVEKIPSTIGQAKQMFINSCASCERGAPPQTIRRTFPPRIFRTFLNITRFRTGVSIPKQENNNWTRIVWSVLERMKIELKQVSTKWRPIVNASCSVRGRIDTLPKSFAFVLEAPGEEFLEEFGFAGGDALPNELV